MRMSKELQVAVKAAEAAAQILRRDFNKAITPAKKSAKELVTKFDVESEKKIISILQKEFPDYSILAEESGSVQKESDFRWIIDPLDGTHNFVWGIPIFGVSIALEKAGVIQCGVIVLPLLEEVYTVERDKGAFLNGKRVAVSSRKMEEAAINICCHLWEEPERANLEKELSSMVFDTRVLGSSNFALAKVASGGIDATIEFHDRPSDFAAGWLLVEEAGGRLTTFEGEKMSFSEIKYIASSGVFHDKLVKVMGGR